MARKNTSLTPTKTKKKSPKSKKTENLKKDESQAITNPLPTDKRFYLDHIYRNIIESPPITEEAQPKGFRSSVKLYHYQKDSLARMYQRETTPEHFADPLWVQVEDDAGNISYQHLMNGSVCHNEPSRIEDEKGGILCENMGTGKTAICIGLILKTRGLKACAVNMGPFVKMPVIKPIAEADNRICSLQQLTAHRILYTWDHNHANISDDLKDYINRLPTPHFFVHEDWNRRSNRTPEKPPKKILISHATLVVVPVALIDQWSQEFNKFVEDGALNILVCKKPSDCPPEDVIAKEYDVVLVTHSCLRKTAMNDPLRKSFAQEECLDILQKIYWYRIIIDEGHIMGVETTNQTMIASKFLAERYWVCTGTPTPNHLANNVDQELKYLHGLISFVKQKPWSENKLWNKLIAKPFKNQDEIALERLSVLLNRIMIRHRPEDIEHDVGLPPLTIEVKKLQLNDLQALRYNQLVAHVKSNLITSRYEGSHSLFDASNRKYAFKALGRLREACFYYDGLAVDERNLVSEEVYKDLDFVDKTKRPLTPEETTELNRIIEVMSVDANLGLADPQMVESAKLKYLMNRLQEIPQEDKVIVFTQFNDTLRRLLDAFDASDIKFAEFHTKMTTSKRSSAVTTFNTSPDVKVILMKTELAAYGINLISANHIFIMEPVWDLSREAQAIKRAHRIGQTKPVFVEKLIVQGTIEEQMLEDFHNRKTNDEANSKETLRKIRSLLMSLKMMNLDMEKVKADLEEQRNFRKNQIQCVQEEIKIAAEEINEPRQIMTRSRAKQLNNPPQNMDVCIMDEDSLDTLLAHQPIITMYQQLQSDVMMTSPYKMKGKGKQPLNLNSMSHFDTDQFFTVEEQPIKKRVRFAEDETKEEAKKLKVETNMVIL